MRQLLFICFFLGTLTICSSQDILMLKTSGKVVIGDTAAISTPGPYNLYVQNGVLTEKVKVAVKTTNEWSDHAFDHTPTLQAVKSSIETNSHLFNMPSASELVEKGYELQSMDARILEQVEWLWQYTIKLAEENQSLRKEIESLKEKVDKK